MSGPYAAPPVDRVVPYVWIARAGGCATAPSDDAARALAGWARARGVALQSPTAELVPPLPFDAAALEAVAARVETLLDAARDAVTALDADAADRALTRAADELRAHPELPQSAWLLAEVERGWSARYARVDPRDAEKSAQAWSRAASLDGGRVAGAGERGTLDTAASSAASSAAAALGAGIIAVPRGERARVDGQAVVTSVATPAGRHAVIVLHDGSTVWADWVTVAAGATVTLPAFGRSPCTLGDLEEARLVGEAAVAEGVRCPLWIAVASAAPPAPTAAIRVAACAGPRCLPFTEWRPSGPVVSTRDRRPEHPPQAGWPAWATWTIVGAGALAVGATVLISTGAFARTQEGTRFVNGGVHATQVAIPLP